MEIPVSLLVELLESYSVSNMPKKQPIEISMLLESDDVGVLPGAVEIDAVALLVDAANCMQSFKHSSNSSGVTSVSLRPHRDSHRRKA